MDVTLGCALDGSSQPEPLGDRDAAHGELRVGPLGFLALLEARGGFKGIETTEPVRIAQYRARLERANDGTRFYSRFFEADSMGVARLGVARTPYRWREELVVGDWKGGASAGFPISQTLEAVTRPPRPGTRRATRSSTAPPGSTAPPHPTPRGGSASSSRPYAYRARMRGPIEAPAWPPEVAPR